jgi:hypothetical protein
MAWFMVQYLVCVDKLCTTCWHWEHMRTHACPLPMSYKGSQTMTLVRKFRAHLCRKSLLEAVNKGIFHLVGVLAPATVHSVLNTWSMCVDHVSHNAQVQDVDMCGQGCPRRKCVCGGGGMVPHCSMDIPWM